MKNVSNIPLSGRWKKVVDSHVASGRYESAREVVEDAIALFDQTERQFQAQLESMRVGVRRGLADAKAGRMTPIKDVTLESVRAMAKFRSKPRRARKSA